MIIYRYLRLILIFNKLEIDKILELLGVQLHERERPLLLVGLQCRFFFPMCFPQLSFKPQKDLIEFCSVTNIRHFPIL